MKQFFFSFLVIVALNKLASAQNVGIGTNTPTYPLTVMGNGKGIIQKEGTVEVGFFTTSSVAYLQTWSNHNLSFSTNNANEQMILTTAGLLGIGTSTPNASALLDVNSTSKGLLMPRMSTAQRTAIISPAKGLMVFDNDTNSFWYFNGNIWADFSATAALTLPYQQSVTTGGYAFDITNIGTGGALKGIANTASGVGVYGETSNGNGVKGYGNNAGSIGVFGSSLAGTGVKATSFTGLALDVVGNLKISGGNTNPSAGALLSSDATGNAVWKPQNKVAFEVKNSQSTPQIAANTPITLPFQTEVFDAGADFNISTAGVDPNTFIAPVAGVYHFSSYVRIGIFSTTQNMEACTFQLYKNGNSIGAIWSPGPTNNSTNSYVPLSINQTVRLNAGDKIKVVVYQTNGGDFAASYQDASFSGYLVFAD